MNSNKYQNKDTNMESIIVETSNSGYRILYRTIGSDTWNEWNKSLIDVFYWDIRSAERAAKQSIGLF